MPTATLAQAKRDYANHLYRGAVIEYHNRAHHADDLYTVKFLPVKGAGKDEIELVANRGALLRSFRTMDAAHKLLRDIGFLVPRFKTMTYEEEKNV